MTNEKQKIARVFPRRTKASPDDSLAFFGLPPLLALPEIDEVHVSVAFSWDMKEAEFLARQWEQVGVPVKMGGPAFNEPGGEFIPGRYLKHGYTITSRGCPNRCWFCAVPKREGYQLRELRIKDGYNVLDDNLLACSRNHIEAVFQMLEKQKRRPEFTGGLEARLLEPWHCEALKRIKARRIYFAYDTPDDLEPLRDAGIMLRDAGITEASHIASCYVLIGYPKDTCQKAEQRLKQTLDAGFVPYAMLYRDSEGTVSRAWRSFQRRWLRPQIIFRKEA